MSTLHYPAITEYAQPEKNVLVISCIDLRLTDNLLFFLHYDNLTNRYDHFAVAGASLCACAKGVHRKHFTKDALETFDFKAWKSTLDDQLKIAIKLHHIRDVYIVEHIDCGAYKKFLKYEHPVTPEAEAERHNEFAQALSDEIRSVTYKERMDDGTIEKYKLNVHCFLIDLRGNVKLMHTTTNLE